MRMAISMILLAASAGAAAASGGLSCEAEDAAVTLAIDSGITRGMGGPLFQFSGRVEIRDAGVAADLGATDFAQKHVPQYWFDGNTLKLLLYREREGDAPHGYVTVVIETESTGDDEGGYAGDYRVSVYDMTDAKSGEAATADFAGAVSCMVE